jgi:hypothetical protein
VVKSLRACADLHEHDGSGDERMPARALRRTIDHAQIAALRARVRERRLVDPDDYLLIDELLGVA